MKKLLSVIALLAFVSVALVGCKPADEGAKPDPAKTNAPAPPK